MGEGAQAFGWGLYFSSKRDIAENYARTLSKDSIGEPSIAGVVPASPNKSFSDVLWRTAKQLSESLVSDTGVFQLFSEIDIVRQGRVLSMVRRLIKNPQIFNSVVGLIPVDVVDMLGGKKATVDMLLNDPSVFVDLLPANADDLVPRSIKAMDVLTPAVALVVAKIQTGLSRFDVGPGDFLSAVTAKNHDLLLSIISKIPHPNEFVKLKSNLYSVMLHKGKSPSEYTYMDWYKKLSPEVINKYAGSLEKKGYGDMARTFRKNAQSMDGRELYRELSGLYGSDKEASAVLLKSGIDGIRYPAGSLSDSNTGDVSNYVVFDDSAVTIEDHVRFQKEKVKAQADFSTFSGGAKERIKEWAKDQDRADKIQDLKEKATYNLIDSMDPLKVIQGYFNINDENLDAYATERLRGKKESGRIKEFRREVIQPTIDRMAKAKITFDMIDEYRHAKHAPEANERLELINAKRTLEELIDLKTGTDANKLLAALQEIKDRYKEEEIDSKEAQQEYLDLLNSQTGTTPEDQEFIDKWHYRRKRLAGIPTFEKDVDLVKNPDEVSAEEILDKYKGNTEIESIRKVFAKIDDDRLTLLEQSGELSADSVNAMRSAYQFYAPLYREGKDGKLTTGRKLGPLGKPIKVRAGSTKGVSEISAHTIANYENAITRSLKSETGRALYDLVKKTATPDKSVWWVEEDPKQPAYDKDGNIVEYSDMVEPVDGIYVKVGGKRHLIMVNAESPTMQRFLESMKTAPEQNGLIKGMSAVNRVLAAVNTSMSPEFMLTNLVKDLQTASIHLEDTELKGMHKAVLKQLPAAIKGIWKAESKGDKDGMAGWYRDFEQNGGKVGWASGYEEIKDISKRLKAELEMASGERKIRLFSKKAFEMIENANAAIENGVRLSVYKTMVEKGHSKKLAAQVASGLTVDFTRKGKQGGTINALYLFANAGIQGNVRMIQAMIKSSRVRKIVVGIVASGFVMNMLGMMMGGDDDDDVAYYDKLRESDPGVFERNIVIMTGKGNPPLKIPMPWGYNAFYNMGHEIGNAVYKVMADKRYDASEGAARVMSGFANSFNPLAAATLLQAIAPTIADPIAIVGENKQWHGGPLMPEQNTFSKLKTPDSERFFKSVSAPSKYIAQTLSRLTGGDDVGIKGGAIDISPETIDLMYETATGQAGRFVMDMAMIPAAKDIKNVPFVRRFVGSISESADNTIYHKALTEVLTVKEQIKEDPAYRKEPMAKMIPLADATEKKLRRFRKHKKKLEAAGEDTTEIESRIADAQKRFVRAINSGDGYGSSRSSRRERERDMGEESDE
jgi:hypothetical protein